MLTDQSIDQQIEETEQIDRQDDYSGACALRVNKVNQASVFDTEGRGGGGGGGGGTLGFPS